MTKLNEFLVANMQVKEWYAKELDWAYRFFTKDTIEREKLLLIWEHKLKDDNRRIQEFFEYLYPKPIPLDFDEFYSENQFEYDEFKGAIWINIKTGQINKVDFYEDLHTFVWGWTWSWKSITILNIYYQLYQNPFTEFYILDKGDFWALAPMKKLVYKGDALNIREDFFNLVFYFWLEQARRKRLFEKYWVTDYRGYQKMYMKWGYQKWMPQLNYIVIILDEYQTMRRKISELFDTKKFDDSISTLFDTVRFAGMKFIVWSQTYYSDDIGAINRGWLQQIYIWISKNVDWVSGYHMANIKKRLKWTYLFYHIWKSQYYKMPFMDEVDLKEKIVSLDNNEEFFWPELPTKYNTVPELLSWLLEKIDSDIIKARKSVYTYFWISEENQEKLQKSKEYLSLTVLLFALRLWVKKKYIAPGFDVFKKPPFEKKEDEILFDSIYLYEKADLVKKNISKCFELWNDIDEFRMTISNIINVYIRSLIWWTSIDDDEDDNDWENILFSNVVEHQIETAKNNTPPLKTPIDMDELFDETDETDIFSNDNSEKNWKTDDDLFQEIEEWWNSIFSIEDEETPKTAKKEEAIDDWVWDEFNPEALSKKVDNFMSRWVDEKKNFY